LSVALHLLLCSFVCHKQKFSWSPHDSIVGSKGTCGVDIQCSFPSEVKFFNCHVWGGSLASWFCLPSPLNPTRVCMCKIVANPSVVAAKLQWPACQSSSSNQNSSLSS
jgi:hypothetical protein